MWVGQVNVRKKRVVIENRFEWYGGYNELLRIQVLRSCVYVSRLYACVSS